MPTEPAPAPNVALEEELDEENAIAGSLSPADLTEDELSMLLDDSEEPHAS